MKMHCLIDNKSDIFHLLKERKHTKTTCYLLRIQELSGASTEFPKYLTISISGKQYISHMYHRARYVGVL